MQEVSGVVGIFGSVINTKECNTVNSTTTPMDCMSDVTDIKVAEMQTAATSLNDISMTCCKVCGVRFDVPLNASVNMVQCSNCAMLSHICGGSVWVCSIDCNKECSRCGCKAPNIVNKNIVSAQPKPNTADKTTVRIAENKKFCSIPCAGSSVMPKCSVCKHTELVSTCGGRNDFYCKNCSLLHHFGKHRNYCMKISEAECNVQRTNTPFLFESVMYMPETSMPKTATKRDISETEIDSTPKSSGIISCPMCKRKLSMSTGLPVNMNAENDDDDGESVVSNGCTYCRLLSVTIYNYNMFFANGTLR